MGGIIHLSEEHKKSIREDQEVLNVRNGIIKCNACGSDMKMVKKVKPKNRKYRVRRYECVCGFKKTLWGDGIRDEFIEPMEAIENAKQMTDEQTT